MKPLHKNVHVVDYTVLPAESQTWVTVKTKRAGLILVAPTRETYERKMCLAATDVYQVQSDDPFSILVAVFRKKQKTLFPNQYTATAEDHQTQLMESYVVHADSS